MSLVFYVVFIYTIHISTDVFFFFVGSNIVFVNKYDFY